MATGLAAALAGSLLAGALDAPAYAAPASDRPNQGPNQGPEQKPADQAEEQPEEEKPEKPPPDTEPPAVPVLGEPTVEPKGEVTLPVTAEDRSQIVVVQREADVAPTEFDDVVADARGTGAVKDLSWTADTGTYIYTVTATDKKGNESPAATVTIEVDATKPKLSRFVVEAGTARALASTVTVVTEPSTTYSLKVDGKEVAGGTTAETDPKPIEATLDLADGKYPVDVRLEDETGNVTKKSKQLVVRIEELLLDAELTSGPTDPEQVVELKATPGTQGTVRVPGGLSEDFRVPASGRAVVSLDLPDGSYEGTRVVVRDTHDRRGTATLPEIVVDTTPPVLEIEEITSEETVGQLVVEVTADQGSLVNWRVLGASGAEVTSGKYVATGEPQTLNRDLEEGSYTIELSTTDVYDRVTERSLDLDVAADPITWQTIAAAAAAALLVLLALALVLWRLWRRRRAKLAERRQQAPVPATQESMAAYERAEAAWVAQHQALTRLAGVARGEVPDDLTLPPGFVLLPGETPLWTTGARLLDVAESGGAEVALEGEPGSLVITDQRFSFVGERSRDWWHSMVQRMRHLDHARTIVSLDDGGGWAGFTYDDPQLTQQYVDLAAANATGGSYAAVVDQGLRAHEMRRPSRPG